MRRKVDTRSSHFWNHLSFLSDCAVSVWLYLNIKHEVPPPSAQFLTESVDENQLINLNLSRLGTTFSSLKKYFVRIIIKITIIFLSCFPVFRSDVSERM